MVVPGVYAWLATVASPSIQEGAPGGARWLALGALVALLLGPLVAFQRPFAGRLVLTIGFVGLSLGTWVLLSESLTFDRQDPFQAILGGLGWVLFAFSWGSHRRLWLVPEEHPNTIFGERLEPRALLPVRARVLLSVALLGALCMLVLAWRVEGPRAALLAQATALGGSILVLTLSADLAVRPPSAPLPVSSDYRLARAARSLGLLAVALVVGAMWLLVR
jgi:hypothetical protein